MQVSWSGMPASMKTEADSGQVGAYITIDNADILLSWGSALAGYHKVLLRVDTGLALGHHAHVQTGGQLAACVLASCLVTWLPRIAMPGCVTALLY